MQGQLQIWTELSHNDLWKSDASRDINEFNKSAAMETIEKKSSFPNKLFCYWKMNIFFPFGWVLQFLWCSLLVSDFQRSMWEYSIHICRCPWFMTGRGQIRDQNPAVFFINYQDNLWTLFSIYAFSILDTFMVPKQLHGRLSTYSQSVEEKKLSHPFRLGFRLGMGELNLRRKEFHISR